MKQELVLVVEDDPSVARFLTRGLREEGWTVDLCVDGELAVEQALRHPYSVIVLDWMLPGLDGVEVVRRWRASGLETPVLMLTAREGVDAIVHGLDAGADGYMTKPFSFEELLARVRALARRGADHAAPVVIGAAEVDLRKRTVRRGGAEEELSSREFDLLDVLLRHRGEVVSRAHVMDRVWGVHFDTSTNLVDVYVRHLRSKLDGDDVSPADSVISTVRGRGYRLRAEADQSGGEDGEGGGA